MDLRTLYGPPGTGKTSTLVGIARDEAASGASVCYLSYTKSAAQEAADRIGRVGRIKPSTIHSLAFSSFAITRAQVVDYVKLDQFSGIVGVPFKKANDDDAEPEEGDEYLAAIALAANKRIDLVKAYDMSGAPGTMERFKMFAESYHRWKGTYGFIDFNDMLLMMMRANAIHLPRFDVVILDEAQDCTQLQWETFSRVAELAKRVYIAGDDDQSIFEWNGAEPHGMDAFHEIHGGVVKVLDMSYRLPRSIHDLAESVIKQVSRRQDKKFDCMPQPGSIVRYNDIMDFDFQDWEGMVLARDRFRLYDIRRRLNGESIPYDMIGGSSPWTSKYADAIRLAIRFLDGDNLTSDERSRLIRNVTPNKRDTVNKEWAREKVMKGLRWWDIIDSIPPHMVNYYASIDVFAVPKVILSTIHQAKGREHRNVTVDLTLSTRAQAQFDVNPDSERRVQYVAVTRASEQLNLCGNNAVL